MLLNVDILFDELSGFEFYNFSEIAAVISDKAKCTDGSLLEFMDDVEYSMSAGDEILVLRQRKSVRELEDFREHLRSRGDWSLDDFLSRQIAVAEKEGYSASYVAVVNDEIFSIYKFSL